MKNTYSLITLNIRYHESFTWDYPTTSDIGYVRLNEPIDPNDFDGTVNTISIADFAPQVGAYAILIGWGATEANGYASATLNYAQSSVVSNEEAFGEYGVESFVPLEYFCTDSTIAGTCGGDSGGPAISDVTYDYAYLWGATSFGSANCEEGYSCFTFVPYFRQWLTDNTGEDFGP